MRIEQTTWRPADGGEIPALGSCDLALAFGSVDALGRVGGALGARIGCSTAGEICGTHVVDETICTTRVWFDTPVAVVPAIVPLAAFHGDDRAAGRAVAQALAAPGLRHVLVFAAGRTVNGSALVAGLGEALPAGVSVTGGIAGDGTRFGRTVVAGGGALHEEAVVAVGLCGEHLVAGYGSLGGWDPFGPERLVTRSEGNVLFELDGRPALDLYERYLGPDAAGLPASGLLFPLSLRTADRTGIVRTILGIDRDRKALVFAGDVPEGAFARLMKANLDRLIEGATGAARRTLGDGTPPELAVLISCVGRRQLLQQRAEEELEAAANVLGPSARVTGFYSYGELCPFVRGEPCALHNQTMTITTLAER